MVTNARAMRACSTVVLRIVRVAAAARRANREAAIAPAARAGLRAIAVHQVINAKADRARNSAPVALGTIPAASKPRMPIA
jgi:hypothetical protein